MDDEESSRKSFNNDQMETDENQLLNETSNGPLTEGDISSVDATVDESSTSNQGFVNAIELSASSDRDISQNTAFNTVLFEEDNATFPGESLHVIGSDAESQDAVQIIESLNDDLPSVPDLTNNVSGDHILNIHTKKTIINLTDDPTAEVEAVEMEVAQVETAEVATAELETAEVPHEDTSVTEEEEPPKIKKVGGAEETEVVSEDELPVVEKPKIKDAENVSDDELPGPKPAELPADTEVVSEDELPTSKKEGQESRKRKTDSNDDDNQDAISDSESSNKKQAVMKNGESKPIPAEKRQSIDETPVKLPELNKYWKVVNDDPTDFTGWTYLLQYVDQESDVEAAREAYDAFLSHYPYCYGYWRKYADYEKRKGSKKKCNEVLERGLKAIPLSVDLWIHYLNHVKGTRTEDHIFIRSQYERAIESCGLEFRSDRLWESYIKWESENGSPMNVTKVYDRLLTIPTLGYTAHFDNFQEHVMSEQVLSIVSQEELVRLRTEVRASTGVQPQLDLPPGEDEPDDHVASEEEAQAIKERIIAARRKIHKVTGEQVAARWSFEEAIKRPYFHVKPLERCQLKNWKTYLEWEKQNGSFKRAYVLHERCLIACALYEEFWLKLVKFLEERIATNPELIQTEREVLERACTVHHLDKPELHLYWAHFEEAHGNPAKAAEILERIEKASPNCVQIQYRRVSLERRRGDHDKCIQLFDQYIANSKNKAIASAFSIKYARFLFHVKKDPVAARQALDDAIVKDPLNQRLHLQRLDLAIHVPDTPFSVLEELVQSYEKQEGAELEVCAAFAWRRRDLAEELGDAMSARAASLHQRELARLIRRRSRKEKHDPPPVPAPETGKKKESTTSQPTSNNNNAAQPAQGGQQYYQQPPSGGPPQGYDQYQQPYPNSWGYTQPPGPYQQPPHPWPQYTNYY